MIPRAMRCVYPPSPPVSRMNRAVEVRVRAKIRYFLDSVDVRLK